MNGKPAATSSNAPEIPFGAWPSAISAAALAEGAVAMSDLRVDSGRIFWRESRPAEGGRLVLMVRERDGEVRQLTPEGFNVRTRVHEYGGASYVVLGTSVVFANFADQRLYLQRPGIAPIALTPPDFRFADCIHDAERRRLICVREDHTAATKTINGEERNEIVAVQLPPPGALPTAADAGTVLVGGWDFVAYPRLSPDGRSLAYIAWAHPHMPWDRAALFVAALDAEGQVASTRALVNAERQSALEPVWSEDGTLTFLNDASGWWNPYRFDGSRISAIAAIDQEFGGPLWQHGARTYDVNEFGTLLARVSKDGRDRLATVADGGRFDAIALPYVALSDVTLASRSHAVMFATASARDAELIEVELATGSHRVLYAPPRKELDDEWISEPRAIMFPTTLGDGKTRDYAHAFFYPPTNPDARGPAGALPPLIVLIHGGPTSVSKPTFSLNRHYWTSRGFALVDVNYGGSTTFGRAYRERLNGFWGVVDVNDAVAAVDYLVESKVVDPERLIIRGGSAGGFTTLAALAFTDRFDAGANYFGVSDIKALAATSHKFERLYDVSLVGPPNAELYRARSPLFHLDGFTEPLITFQGSEDRIVPPEQSRMIANALKARGVPSAYLEFAGEQHGFRKAENIIRSAEAELYFYGRIFGFTPAEPIAPVEIANLPPG